MRQFPDDSRVHIRVQREFMYLGFELAFLYTSEGKSFVATNIEFTERPKDGKRPDGATLRIQPEVAQELMDGLYTAGVRPTEGIGSAGAMAAVQEHLKDLQKIVFEKQKFTA